MEQNNTFSNELAILTSWRMNIYYIFTAC
jgi:hypothetical protein